MQLLELLKNIFTLENCVFVLAIDYDVVVKGLEPKFGILSAQNEREFRSFFDKIIQVPFSMPVTSYKADDFLRESLHSIGYINEKQANNNKLIEEFSEISNLTVGTNPRALKRLLNSISLINCINAAKGNKEEEDQLNDDIELLINFALVSIQIAYPPVYRLLSSYPGFDGWNESVALQMNLEPLDKQSIDKLNSLPEFDDEWEQVLFRLCENDHYLKKRALNISRLLNNLKKFIEEKEEDIENIIGSIISLSAVTNLEVLDKPQEDYHRGLLLKNIGSKIIPVLIAKLPHLKNSIKQVGTRVTTNFELTLAPFRNYRMSSHPKDGGINLYLNTGVWFSKKKFDFITDLKNAELFEEFEKIAIDYRLSFDEDYKIITHD